MKKILLLILTLFLFLSCYFIYNFTERKDRNILLFGDYLVNNFEFDINHNSISNDDYRVIDLINIIKYNQNINNSKNIHQLLNNADILVISIGMNDVYYKLNNNVKDVYTHLNKTINDIEILFDLISKYNYEKVFFLGFYNIYNYNNDYFDYINQRVKKIAMNRNIEFIDLNNTFNNNYLLNDDNFMLNKYGYMQICKILVEKVKKC